MIAHKKKITPEYERAWFSTPVWQAKIIKSWRMKILRRRKQWQEIRQKLVWLHVFQDAVFGTRERSAVKN